MIIDERISYAQSMFTQYPEHFPEDRQKLILDGVVVIGMTPFEAKLAGGAFFYSVSADPIIWSSNSDPLKVMWAQSTRPDNSDIWMRFTNATQFPEQGEITFQVYFAKGRAVKIEQQQGMTDVS
jgi:hypothetical protein